MQINKPPLLVIEPDHTCVCRRTPMYAFMTGFGGINNENKIS